jgi:hypothetical protein
LQSSVLVLVLTLVGLGLRMAGIERQSLWLDEAGRVAIAALPWSEIRGGVEVIELSPPLYHYLLHGWMLLVGAGDGAVRMLSVLLVLPTVPLAWWLGSTVAGRGVACGLAAMVAANPFAVHYGQEAAMYALLLPLSLATIGAAVSVLTASDSQSAPEKARRRRVVWLLVYIVAGVLALYTHYYVAFLLLSVAVVGVADALVRRAWHGAIFWIVSHAIIAIAFLPWLPVFLQQARLAASVEDWGAVSISDAIGRWSAALLAFSSTVPLEWTTVLVLVGMAVGGWRLRDRGPTLWLLGALVALPLVLGIAAAEWAHSFRERGYLAVAAAAWLLLAAAVLAPRVRGAADAAARAGLGLAVILTTIVGLASHLGQRGEDWRSAAAVVQALAAAEDPIFFVHFAGQLPFDRYFRGGQSRIGLPASFRWEDGYTARYRVTPEDVARRAAPALAGASQAWVVLSHDGGRGSEHLLALLHDWGVLASDYQLSGVRVLRFVRAPSHDEETTASTARQGQPGAGPGPLHANLRRSQPDADKLSLTSPRQRVDVVAGDQAKRRAEAEARQRADRGVAEEAVGCAADILEGVGVALPTRLLDGEVFQPDPRAQARMLEGATEADDVLLVHVDIVLVVRTGVGREGRPNQAQQPIAHFESPAVGDGVNYGEAGRLEDAPDLR